MTIDRSLVLYLETLARIRLSEEERARCEGELQSIIGYFDQLSALDTNGVAPMSHVLPLRNVMREDAVSSSLPTEKLLQNAPREKDGCFLVQRAVEG
ncbi:MAG: Asp-tRNA(Asn)/Glu-tRNA(Gln) amidotransferase subunit GatC [Oscillospiraceae bacterium]|jgi:aspartyl-tRNA(Asn)/glutamyl-tRNA(Gln) amidotransferase subunit C|nr:Asp-tRNA(Asn)/Glu-tRNA(Gln) amidotransferase subunit GatC [Oscillospiraceae bacterium]